MGSEMCIRDSPCRVSFAGGTQFGEKANHMNISFPFLIKNEKWPRSGSPGHGFECRPLNWLSFFAENPFPATPGPGEAHKSPKIARKIPQNIPHPPFFKNNSSLVQLHSGALEVLCAQLASDAIAFWGAPEARALDVQDSAALPARATPLSSAAARRPG